jgi:hypothetical protein
MHKVCFTHSAAETLCHIFVSPGMFIQHNPQGFVLQQQPYQPQTAGFSDISGGYGYNQPMPQQRPLDQMTSTQSTVTVMNCCTRSRCGGGSCCNGCWDGGEYGGGFPIASFSAAAALFSCPTTLLNRNYCT